MEVKKMIDWSIIGIGLILFFIPFVSYFWLRNELKGQRMLKIGDKDEKRIDFDSMNRNLPPATFLRKNYILSRKGETDVEKSREETTPQTFPIDRAVRISYSRSVYIKQSFYVNVSIGSEGKKFSQPTEKEEKVFSHIEEKLQFDALEEEPLIQVELQFTEGEFSANKIVERKKLKKEEDTHYHFLLKPLIAEHCVLTIAISYISSMESLPQIVEKVIIEKEITKEDSMTKEHTVHTTQTPSVMKTEAITVKKSDLLVSVKSIFGMNSRQLILMRNLLTFIVTAALIALALFTSRTDSYQSISLLSLAAFELAGVPITDHVKKLSELDAPEGEEDVSE
jgi:hypothetical protein